MSSETTQEKNCRAHLAQAGAGGSSGTFELPEVTSRVQSVVSCGKQPLRTINEQAQSSWLV